MCSVIGILDIERKKVGAALLRDKADPRDESGLATLQAWLGQLRTRSVRRSTILVAYRGGATSRHYLVPVRTPEGAGPSSNPQSAKPSKGRRLKRRAEAR